MIRIFFAVLILGPFNSLCQECVWSSIVNDDGKNSPGSKGTFTVTSTSTKAPSAGDFITWSLGSDDIAQHFHNGSSWTSSILSSSDRYGVSISIGSANAGTSTLTINNLLLSEKGLIVGVRRIPCSGDTGNGRTITLVIENCNKTFYQPYATASNPSTTCGFDCSEQFNCEATECRSGSFSGVCQTNAIFSPATENCTKITCGKLPEFMRFVDNTANVACGSTKEVECDGGSDLCGSTTGECTTTDNEVTLANASFTCSPECLVRDFVTVATTKDPNPLCGGNATFQCRNCGTFTRSCERNGKWAASAIDPCPESCNGDGGLSGGAMAGIVIGVLVASWPSFYL